MQSVGMLRGTRAIYLIGYLVLLIGYGCALPLQFLPSIPGYIPVYIRHGDQPLEEINPALAEAFHERQILAKSLRDEGTEGLIDELVPIDEKFAGKKPAEKTYKSSEDKSKAGNVYYHRNAEIIKQEFVFLPKVRKTREVRNEDVYGDEDDDTNNEKGVPTIVPDASGKKPSENPKGQRKGVEIAEEPSEKSPTKDPEVSIHQAVNADKEEEVRPNELYDPSRNYPEQSSSQVPQLGGAGGRDIGSVIKVEPVSVIGISSTNPVEERQEEKKDDDEHDHSSKSMEGGGEGSTATASATATTAASVGNGKEETSTRESYIQKIPPISKTHENKEKEES